MGERDTARAGNVAELRRLLDRIDGRGYGAYKELAGAWQLGPLRVTVEKVQSDPYAPPTRLHVACPPDWAGLPADLWSTPPRRRGIEDHLGRLLRTALRQAQGGFRVDAGGQEVLERTTCSVADGGIGFRIGIELPARGRRIRGRQAAAALTEELPDAFEHAVPWDAIDQVAARAAVDAVEDATALRAALAERGLVAFVADGAVLPRRTGIDDRPLTGPAVVPFTSPPSLRGEVDLPNRGATPGMGIPEGVTVIVGGGYHGKSTLLRAVERGVYDHVPGDGRELVVTRPDAVKIRAEDGRRVERVDISAFVRALPHPNPEASPPPATDDFSTDNASGSTSQAANIVEALELGAGALLIDEDTSATNLMIRDRRMQQLVSRDREPLTPFVDLVRPLHRDHGVSTVLVVGGAGDYLEVADTVVLMDEFRPEDVTERAHEVAAAVPGRQPEPQVFPPVRHRVPDPDSVDPRRRGRVKTRARGTDALGFGHENIDLTAVEQVVDPSQTTAIGLALTQLAEDGWLDGATCLRDALDAFFAELDAHGLDHLRRTYPGDLARPRPLEVGAALNRLRTLRIATIR